MAGRAGRGDKPGRVIIQTYLPDDPVIRAVAMHDRSIFTDHDHAQRSEALYPPFVRLVNILAWGADERATRTYVERVAAELREDVAARAAYGDSALQILGPAPCVIERAKDRYRYHVIVKAPFDYPVSETVGATLASVGAKPGVSVSVDVDAYDLM